MFVICCKPTDFAFRCQHRKWRGDTVLPVIGATAVKQTGALSGFHQQAEGLQGVFGSVSLSEFDVDANLT